MTTCQAASTGLDLAFLVAAGKDVCVGINANPPAEPQLTDPSCDSTLTNAVGDSSGTSRIDYLGEISTGCGNRPFQGSTAFVRLLYRF